MKKKIRDAILRRAVWLVCALSCALPLCAADIAVHGFGTLGAAYIDKPDDWAYSRFLNQRSSTSDVRTDLDSVIGFQLNYRPGENIELVGQASLTALDSDAKVLDYLDLAFLAWQPAPEWSLRLGRVNLDAYLISDYRDVGFTQQTIRPPVEFYSRMPTSLDGVDIMRSWVFSDVQWQAKLYLGRTSGGSGGLRTKLRPVYGVMVSRDAGGLLLRLSAVRARATHDLPALAPLQEGLRQLQMLPIAEVASQAAALEAAIRTRGVSLTYFAAAAAYDRNNWLLTAEFNRANASGPSTLDFTSGYLSAGRRFGALSAFVQESVAVRDRPRHQPPDWVTPLTPMDAGLAQQAQALAQGASVVINRAAPHQFTTSLGARWDVTPRVALKIQWDHVRTRRDGDGLWQQSDGRPVKANVLAVAADFVF
jgi:hypothetical protein